MEAHKREEIGGIQLAEEGRQIELKVNLFTYLNDAFVPLAEKCLKVTRATILNKYIRWRIDLILRKRLQVARENSSKKS